MTNGTLEHRPFTVPGRVTLSHSLSRLPDVPDSRTISTTVARSLLTQRLTDTP
jgi:hypothetical protein